MTDIEDSATSNSVKNEKQYTIAKLMLGDFLQHDPTEYTNNTGFESIMRKLIKKYKYIVPKRIIGEVYKTLNDIDAVQYPMLESLRITLLKKAVRSASGIVNISVVMPPDRFSCKYNCKFCPNETIANGATFNMPRSYLSNEDAVRRAHQVGFNTIDQVNVRFKTLESNGHPIDKIEFRILGGTFSCYEHAIADIFIRDLYYAANTYYDPVKRTILELSEEQHINTTSKIHVVGLGVETRPDEITLNEIIRFRKYGVTRVELGVQHTNDTLLRMVNRGHGVKQSKEAIRLLKEYGFKIEIHIMTDLPGTTPEIDKECYRLVLKDDPDLLPDYMKDYPCLDVKFTEIKHWKEDGRWTPYAEKTPDAKDLKNVLIYRQSITPKWVRVNRVQRDFAVATQANNYMGFTSSSVHSNLGDEIKKEAEARGIYCQCIRCCEVRYEAFDTKDIIYSTHTFQASGAQEYFLCAEIPRPHRNLMLGFIRLRLCTTLGEAVISELRGKTAMIRELHVYGHVKPVGSDGIIGAQHLGIGSTLLSMAEDITRNNKYKKLAIIAGIGVRDYYHKHRYILEGSYMIKYITHIPIYNNIQFYIRLMIYIQLILYIISKIIY